jgi:hypothetical protein
LTILPTSLFICAVPFHLLHHLRCPIYVSRSLLLWAKIVSWLVVVVVHASLDMLLTETAPRFFRWRSLAPRRPI